MTGYLSPWMGALLLSGVGIVFCHSMGRPLGLSGYLGRLLNWGAEVRAFEQEQQAWQNQQRLKQQVLAATLQQFRDHLSPEELHRMELEYQATAQLRLVGSRLSPYCCLAFIVGLPLGGMLSALWRGAWRVAWDVGGEPLSLFGSPQAALVGFGIGGLLVGFGTALAGGCTSGHGLSGCSRAQPGSLAATAVFLGVAILSSLLWHAARG